MFSLESPQSGNSNDYTQCTIFNTKKKITLNYPKVSSYGIFAIGLKNEFETAAVNESSVFKPLKVYCFHEISSSQVLLAASFSLQFRHFPYKW